MNNNNTDFKRSDLFISESYQIVEYIYYNYMWHTYHGVRNQKDTSLTGNHYNQIKKGEQDAKKNCKDSRKH